MHATKTTEKKSVSTIAIAIAVLVIIAIAVVVTNDTNTAQTAGTDTIQQPPDYQVVKKDYDNSQSDLEKKLTEIEKETMGAL